MDRIHYAGNTLTTGSAIAHAVLAYAWARPVPETPAEYSAVDSSDLELPTAALDNNQEK